MTPHLSKGPMPMSFLQHFSINKEQVALSYHTPFKTQTRSTFCNSPTIICAQRCRLSKAHITIFHSFEIPRSESVCCSNFNKEYKSPKKSYGMLTPKRSEHLALLPYYLPVFIPFVPQMILQIFLSSQLTFRIWSSCPFHTPNRFIA